jgi:hypothetical protein
VGSVASLRTSALEESSSLARRIYLYLTLLGGVLALLGAGVTAVYQLYLLALGAAATPSVITNLARALAVAAVAAVVVAYHLRILRQDLASQSAAAPAPEPSAAPVLSAPSAATPYGVVVRRDGGERSVWFATLEEARAELDRVRASTDGLGWAVLVTADLTPTAGGASPPPAQSGDEGQPQA